MPGTTKMIGVVNARNGSFREYPIAYGETHVQSDPAMRFFVGDGSDKHPFLHLYELVDGKMTGRPIFRHGGTFARQHWHLHPAFSPDGTTILFTSNRAGNGDVYLIRIAR
jgi:hypothetical protein